MLVLTKKGVSGVQLGRHFILSQEGVPNDATLEMETSTFGTDGTTAIQNVLKRRGSMPMLVDCDTKTRINEGGVSVWVGSNTTLNFINGGGWVTTTGSNCVSVINENPVGMVPDGNGGEKLGACIDENISFKGRFTLNMNGFRGLVGQQAHHIDNVTWTMGVNMMGVKNLDIESFFGLNQRTFTILLANCENVKCGLLDFRCNPTRQTSGDYAGFYSGNTDGIKILACRNVTIDKIQGTCGDDLFSVVGNDGLFPPGKGGPANFVHPYMCYGPCINIHIKEVFFDGSDFGGRFLSTDSLINNVRIDYMHGTTQGQFFVSDNLARGAGACYQKAAGANGGGQWGRIRFGTIDVECTGLAPYYKAWMFFETDTNSGGSIKSIIIDKISRTANSRAGFPTIQMLNLGVKYMSINGSEIDVDNAGNDNPLLALYNCSFRKLKLANCDMDRSVGATRTTGPILVIDNNTFIGTLALDNLSATKANFLVEQRNGNVNTLVATKLACDGFNAYYLANGSSIYQVFASSYASDNADFFLANSGTITKRGGDAFASSTGTTTAVSGPSSAMLASPNPFTPPTAGQGGTKAVRLTTTGNALTSPIASVQYRIRSNGTDYDINGTPITASSGSNFPFDWMLSAQGNSVLQLFSISTCQDGSTLTSPLYNLTVQN